MLKLKTFLFSFFFILLSSSLVSAHYWDFVTIGQGDNRWCRLFGTCQIDNLIVKNLTIDNGTVNFINKTVININVTGEMIIDGGLEVDNITVDNIFALIDEINMRNNVNYNENNLNNASNVTAKEFFGNISDIFVKIALGSGSPTIDQLQEYLDSTGSSGFFTGGDLSDGGSGTIDVSAGSGFIRTTNDDTAELQSFKWSASSGIAVEDNTTQYVYVDNNGVISLSQNEFLEAPNKIKIGVVTDENGSTIHSFKLGVRLEESIGEAGRFIRNVHGIARNTRLGGLIFGQSGDANRDVTMTTGQLEWGRTSYPMSAFDTSGTDNFTTYIASGLVNNTDSNWDNENYDNSGTLTEMINNRWANLFFFLEPDDHIVMIYGREQFVTMAQAELEGVPSTSLPSRVSQTSVLASRFTFKKSTDTATIASAFDTLFANAGATDHGNLAGLSDDDHQQYLILSGIRAMTGQLNGTSAKFTGGVSVSSLVTNNISCPDGTCEIDSRVHIGEEGDQSGSQLVVAYINTTGFDALVIESLTQIEYKLRDVPPRSIFFDSRGLFSDDDGVLDLGLEDPPGPGNPRRWRNLNIVYNGSFGDNILIDGTNDKITTKDLIATGDITANSVNSSSWLNVTITESQVTDLSHIGNCSVSGSCSSIVYNDTSDSYVFNEIEIGTLDVTGNVNIGVSLDVGEDLNVTGDNLGRRIIGLGFGGDPAHTFIMATDSSGGIKNVFDITREVNDVTNAAIGDGVRIRGRLKDQSRTANVAAIEFISQNGGAARNGEIVFRTAISNSLQIAMTIDSGKDISMSGDLDVVGKVTGTGGVDPPYVLYDMESRETIVNRARQEISISKAGGMAQFYNFERERIEYFKALTCEFYVEGIDIFSWDDKFPKFFTTKLKLTYTWDDGEVCYNTNSTVIFYYDRITDTIKNYTKAIYDNSLPIDKVLDKATGIIKDRPIEDLGEEQ